MKQIKFVFLPKPLKIAKIVEKIPCKQLDSSARNIFCKISGHILRFKVKIPPFLFISRHIVKLETFSLYIQVIEDYLYKWAQIFK